MEEQRNERECHRGNERTHQNKGHTFADAGLRLIGQVAEDGEQDQRSQVIAGHDDTDQPLNIQDLGRITCFQFCRRHMIHAAGKNVRQESGAPGIVDLPEKQDAKEGKTDQECPLVIQLHNNTSESVAQRMPRGI